MATRAVAPEKPRSLVVDITPSVEAGQALDLRKQAGELIVVDKASHTRALEFLKGAKQLKRTIESHWQNITRNVDALKTNLLTLKRQDLAPVEEAIAVAEKLSLAYESAENARIQAETERNRIAAEEKAAKERAAELERMEREALKAEAGSPDLSSRETVFVHHFVQWGDATKSAAAAGFKDAEKRGTLLLTMPKIQRAILARQKAVAIREQATAKREEPLDVETKAVESQLGKAAGVSTRWNYSCNPDVDLTKLAPAVVAGDIDYDAIEQDLVFLNREAVRLKDSFEKVYPGCKLVKKPGIAG